MKLTAANYTLVILLVLPSRVWSFCHELDVGKIDILLVPIAGGYFTVTPTEAREVTKLVNPKIAIPKHFWWEQAVQEYTQGLTRVRMLNTPLLKISKPELPPPTETIVMPWGQR